MRPGGPELTALAGAYGVQTEYYDVTGTRRVADPEVLSRVLEALGAFDGESGGGTSDRTPGSQQSPASAIVAWDGVWPAPADNNSSSSRSDSHLELEDGSERRVRAGETARLPFGYHHLVHDASAADRSAPHSHPVLLISAPSKAYPLPEKCWGAFIPLYALRSARAGGAGDLADLERLRGWLARQGAALIGTLPINAQFYDEESYNPSPYAPVTRLFWNELYLPLEELPELRSSPEARRILASPGYASELDRLSRAPHVDYRKLFALRNPVLAELARTAFASTGRRRDQLERFISKNPLATEYARFRADRSARPDNASPVERTDRSDTADTERQYHLYVQWILHNRLAKRRPGKRPSPVKAYFDLPLGVHPDGFDVHRFPEAFATGISAGAPPDPLFWGGQDWGFPPLHPRNIRQDDFRYFREVIGRQMAVADVLRIDHIMCMNRLFWIPTGSGAKNGIYVNYPAEELYAILTLESHRHRTAIIGENLGTVPDEVNSRLERHGLGTMYVVPFELRGGDPPRMRDVPAESIVCLNTHDMPTFAAFWNGLDDETRRQFRAALDLPDDGDLHVMFARILEMLGRSPAAIVLLNLEDLWAETEPQNVPGTLPEANWTRKSRLTLEEMENSTDIPPVFAALRSAR